MALDAGIIQTSAELDIAQFQRGVAQLLKGIEQLNQSMESIKPATPRVATDKLTNDVEHGRIALRGFIGDLGLIPGISTGASASLFQVGSGAAGMAAGIAVAAAATAALVAGMKAATEQAVALEFQVAAVKSIKLDLDTKAATNSLRELAAETGQSADSLAKGLYNLFSSINVPQTQAVQLMRQFAQGAVAAQSDASTFGTAIIGVLNAYKLSVDDAAHVSDVFFNTVRDGVVTGAQLAASLGPVTASAKNAGVSLEELGALITAVTKEGGDAAQNINNLNNLLAKLVTKETTQQFKDLGIAVADASGKLKSPLDILTSLQARLESLTEAQKASALQELFPDLQARQGVQTLLSQLEQVRTSLVANRTEVGSTKTAYETMAATNKAALDRLQQSVSALATTFGDALLPALTSVVSLAADLVTGFSSAGRAIDAFLASASTRQAAAVLIEAKTAADRAAAATAQAGGGAVATAVGAGAALPIPQAPTEPTGAGQFVQRGLDQLGGVTAAGLKAAQDAMSGLTEAEKALVEQHRERIKAEEALADLNRRFGQDEREATKGAQDRAAAQRAAAQAAADAIQLTATAQQRLAAGLAAGIGVQADWNAELVKALDPAKNLSGVAGTELVQGILRAKQATEESAKAFEIHDLAVAAEVIRLRDLAAKTTDVAEAQRLQAQANNLAAAEIEAEKRGLEGATAAAAALAKPLDTLASSILPALTAAQVAHVAEIEHTQGKYAALAEAAAQAGVDISKFGDLTQLTGAQLADVKAQVEAAVKGFAGFLKEEDKSRFSSVLGTLASATDSATAAQAKLLEASGKTDEALALLLQHAGAAPQAIKALEDALKAGGAAAFQAREAIQTLTTFIRDQQGQVRLKVDVDIEVAEKKLFQLQQDFQDANTKRAQAETKATREFQDQQATTAQAQGKLQTDYRDAILQISQARTDSSQQLGRDIQKAVSTENDALQKISRAREDATNTFVKTIGDAQDKLFQTATDLGQKFGEGLGSIAEKAQAALETFAKAQASALQALSSAMTSFNQQQVQNAFEASVAAQDAATKTLADTGVFGAISNQDRIKQIQEAGRAALAQQKQQDDLAKAQNSIAQQQLDATKTLDKTMAALAKETTKLRETFAEDIAKATATADKANRDALDKLEKSNRDTAAETGQATEKARNAEQEARRQDRERQREQDQKQQEAQQKFFDTLIKEGQERAQDPEGKFRTKAEQAFDEAEKARREEQRKEKQAFLEEQARIKREIENNRLLKAIAAGLEIPAQTFQFERVTAVETQTDFIDAATARLRARVQSGV